MSEPEYRPAKCGACLVHKARIAELEAELEKAYNDRDTARADVERLEAICHYWAVCTVCRDEPHDSRYGCPQQEEEDGDE